ncbi:hypothetical protein ScPMuIL_009136 [Solemya velum]
MDYELSSSDEEGDFRTVKYKRKLSGSSVESSTKKTKSGSMLRHLKLFAVESGSELKGPIRLFNYLKKHVGNVSNVKYLRDGGLLITADDGNSYMRLKHLLAIDKHAVKVSHPVISTTGLSGVIADIPTGTSDNEIVDALKQYGVIAAHRITKRVRGEQNLTTSIKLIFSKDKLPEKIRLGYSQYTSNSTFSPVIQCYSCRHFGHYASECSFFPTGIKEKLVGIGVKRSCLYICLVLCVLSYVAFFHVRKRHPSETAFFHVRKRHPSETHYLCPVFNGRLGNLMFEYASVYGIAMSKGFSVGIDKSDEVYKTFNLSVKPIHDRSICKKAELFKEHRACSFNYSSYNFNQNADVRHDSYLQSWKYFEDCENEIRKQFVFKQDIQRKAEILLSRYTSIKFNTSIVPNLTIVGVHVRRGDLLSKANIKVGYRVANKEYLSRAFDFFYKRYEKLLFLVFTNPNKNDQKWCRENISERDTVFAFGNPPKVDMNILVKCNHTIMTVGTFGWWSSWLNKGTTIYLKNFTTPSSIRWNKFSADKSDYFYPGWIGL